MFRMIGYYWAKLIKKIQSAAIIGSTIGEDSKVESGSQFINSTMGRHSFCGYDCFINMCTIGSFVSIANHVVIGGGIHPMDWVSTSPVFYNNRDSVKKKYSRHERPTFPRTVIGNDVWIGDGAHLKAGITVGNGAVIGMGSVVTKDVLPYEIVAGAPAKRIRMRFTEDICRELDKTHWWDFDDKLLMELAQYIKDPELFLEMLRKKIS